MRKKVKDVVAINKEKQKTLNDLSAQALDVVTNTINTLEFVNTEIDSTVGDIDATVNELTDTKSGLTATKTHNEAIIAKFRNLIAG